MQYIEMMMLSSTTCYLAARLITDFLGFITKEKESL